MGWPRACGATSGGTARYGVTVEPFRRLTSVQKEAVREETNQLGKFLGAPATVSFSRWFGAQDPEVKNSCRTLRARTAGVLAGGAGFDPALPESKSGVLPD